MGQRHYINKCKGEELGGGNLVYTSDQIRGKVHRKSAIVFPQTLQPEQGGEQSPQEAEGTLSHRTPGFLHISLALEQSVPRAQLGREAVPWE